MPLVRPSAPAPVVEEVETAVAASPVSLPDEDALRDMIASLLDRKTLVHRSYGTFTEPQTGEVAFFDDDEGTLAAIAYADTGFAAATAAALALVPVEKVETAVESGELDELLRDNYYEVINILSSLLNENPQRHVRLTTTHRLGDDLPVDATSRLADAVATRSYNVEIDGYGTGTFHFVAL